MSTLETTIEQKKKANKIIRFRTLFATGAGLIPFPLVDAAGILAIQLWMIKDLAKVYGIPFIKHIAKSLIGALLGDLGIIGAASLVKFIPGAGTIPGMAATAVSGGAATFALGKLFHQHFSQGGTLLSFDPVKSREYFRKLYDEGRAAEMATMQAQQTGMETVQAQALASTDVLKKANDELRATIAVLQTQLKQGGEPKPAVAILQNLKKGKRRRWLVPLLLLLLVGGTYGAYRAGLFRPKKMAEMAAEVSDAAAKAGKAAAETASDLSDAAVAAVADTTSSNPADSTAAAKTPAQADSTVQKKEAQPPTPPDAAALGFAAGTTEAQMADYLSKPKSKFPKTFPLSAVQFEEGATELSPEAKQQVANVAKLLQSYPEVKVKLYGQTDQNAGLAVNRQAGLNRAKSIENVLKQAGVPGRRLEIAYREKQAEPQGKRGAEIEMMKQ